VRNYGEQIGDDFQVIVVLGSNCLEFPFERFDIAQEQSP
jgi:hypothetical protein